MNLGITYKKVWKFLEKENLFAVTSQSRDMHLSFHLSEKAAETQAGPG